MKIVFFGTPNYVLPILTSIHKKYVTKQGESPIVAVVTQGPKPVGRKKILEYSPVDKWAHQRNIPVFYGSKELLKADISADIGILESYGEILPNEVITMFPHGILNAHPSLLPKWRGASPVQATILSGEKETGVTIIRLDKLIDHGPIISQFKEDISSTDTTDLLRSRLFEKSATVLIELIEPYLSGKIKSRPQDDAKATFTSKIVREDGFVPPEYLQATLLGTSLKMPWKIKFVKDFSLPINAKSFERFIRAMSSWPGTWSLIKLNPQGEGKRLKILEAHLDQESKALVFDSVQLEGKNPVSWKQFRVAYPNAKF